jgi:uncharacterized protein (DUF433 family)
MPRWKPGVRHGRPVIVKFVIPVRFMPVSWLFSNAIFE